MFKNLEESWKEVLKDEIKKPYINSLQEFLRKEGRENKIIYPPLPLLWQAFNDTPFSKVKVVVVGQDPYHGMGQANGLSFSVPCGMPQPPSLKNIFKELESDLGISPPKNGCLRKWAEQGVLLLNATLTVRNAEPKSHYGKGWETFTDHVIRILAERKDPLVFLLWGKSAKEKYENVIQNMSHPHKVLMAAHPSPYSANDGFFGCRHFSQTNHFLEKNGKKPINWKLD